MFDERDELVRVSQYLVSEQRWQLSVMSLLGRRAKVRLVVLELLSRPARARPVLRTWNYDLRLEKQIPGENHDAPRPQRGDKLAVL